jgi:glutamyl/glutaminyl-tRNA synthetase
VQWLGFHWSGDVRYSSDYFDQLHNYAVELISKGLAYVDELSADEIREYRGTLTRRVKTARIAIVRLKRTWRCLKKCEPVASKKVRRACVRRSIWRRRSS